MPGARESNRTLADVANSFTKLNSSYNYFHGKIYSFIPPEPQKFAEFSAAFRVQSKMFQQLIRFAGLTKTVTHTYTVQRRWMFFGQQFGNCTAQAADDLPLFGSNDTTSFAYAL